MQKSFCSLAIAALLTLVIPTCALGAAAITVRVNGTAVPFDVPPIMEQNRVLVPLRACADALGADVDYNRNGTITLTRADFNVTLQTNSTQAQINGKPTTLDVPAKVVNGSTLVPMRFIGDSLNAQVKWDQKTSTVLITDKTPPQPLSPPSVGMQKFDAELLEAANDARRQAGLQPFVSLAVGRNMALHHASDMAARNKLLNTGTAFRAATFNLPTPAENIAGGKSTAQEIIDAWLENDIARGNLLNPAVFLVGIGSYEGSGGANCYTAMEFFAGQAFFTSPHQQTISDSNLTLLGVSCNKQENITVYQLSATDSNTYLNKKSFPVEVVKGEFSLPLTLAQNGKYAVIVGEDRLNITKTKKII